MKILCETEMEIYTGLFLYFPEQIGKSKEKENVVSVWKLCQVYLLLLFLSYGNITSEVHFAVWYTVEICPSCVTDCLLGARCFIKIKEGSSCKEKHTAIKKYAQNTTEWEILGHMGFCGCWHSGSRTVTKLECVIETEPNPAFKITYLSPFPTAIFWSSKCSVYNCFDQISRFEDYVCLFWNWQTLPKKTPTCLHMYATFQKL